MTQQESGAIAGTGLGAGTAKDVNQLVEIVEGARDDDSAATQGDDLVAGGGPPSSGNRVQGPGKNANKLETTKPPVRLDQKAGQEQASPPASLPALPSDSKDLPGLVSEQLARGDQERADALIAQALARHPDDPGLKVLQRLVQRKVKDQDPKALQRKIDAIASLAAPGAAPEALHASVVSFGGAARATPRPEAFAPAAMLPESLRNSPNVEALKKLKMGDYGAAERLLLRRLEQFPDDQEAWRNLALVRYQTRRYRESLRDIGRSLELDNRDKRARNIKVMDLLALDRPDEARAEADLALAQDPGDAGAYVLRARAWGALGNEEARLADLKAAAELDEQFDSLYQDALKGGASASGNTLSSWRKGRSKAVWIGAVGTALLFFSFVLYRKRGDTSIRAEMRSEDRDLARAAAPAAPRPDAVPRGFRVVKTLGMGGMGVVYEAVDLALQRPVALKKLRPEVSDNPRERARFLKEARLVAGLRHPSIVAIHSIHEDEEGLFLVFEKVPGETLHERLGRGALEPAEAVFYLRQVATALDYAHAQGVVHQDLKPANVMVHGAQAKVMDFGIARRVQETLSTLSKVEIAGTPAYMAPEQEEGGRIGPAADVYALGVCAYEMLTGRLPYPQGGLMAKAQRLYRPATDGTPLPKDVDAVVAKALDPVPPARPASASAFVDALARSLA